MLEEEEIMDAAFGDDGNDQLINELGSNYKAPTGPPI